MEDRFDFYFSPQPPAGPEPPRSRLFSLEPRDTVFAVLLCLTAIVFSAFGLWDGFHAGFTASALLGFAVCSAYLRPAGARPGFYPLLCGILACLLSCVFFITSNGTVRFLSLLLTGLMSAVWFSALGGRTPGPGDLGLLATVFRDLTGGMCGKMPMSMASLFASKGRRKKGIGKMLLGAVLALPVLMIVVPLLMSSDAAFSGMAGVLADNLGDAVAKVAVGMLLAPFLVAYCFSLRKTPAPQSRERSFRGIENAITVPFLSVLSACYLAYLFSQLAYFFSAFQGFLPQGYTFSVSEYARRGFFEMTVIAALNFGIVFGAVLLGRKQAQKLSMPVRLLSLFISVFTLIIIATALSKMGLYISSFGMTVLRVTTSAFMVFLAVVFLSLILRLFFPKVRVVQTALITAGCVLLLLGGVNVNRVVASYNYDAYRTGALERIDVQTLAELGDEGIPYLAKLTEDAPLSVAAAARGKLESMLRYQYYDCRREDGRYIITQRQYRSIGAYSIARDRAYRVLDQYIRDNPEVFEFAK